MAIIIKEITIKTIIERNLSETKMGEKEKKQIKKEIILEVKELLTKARLRNSKR